jgi:hypothetical protein
VPSGVREGTFAEQLLNNRLQTEGLHCNWELRNANKTNENRSVQTGQGELENRGLSLQIVNRPRLLEPSRQVLKARQLLS